MTEESPNVPSLAYHRLVWKNDVEGLKKLIKQQAELAKSTNKSTSQSTSQSTDDFPTHLIDINSQDIYGNTPLMLAVQLSRFDCVKLLLHAGARTKYRNSAGWTPLAESISQGQRDVIREIVHVWGMRSEAELDHSINHILSNSSDIPDFTLKVDWKFSSWIPLLGRALPHDEWTITKKGTSIRIDTSLVDFKKGTLSWKRGSLSFLFCFENEPKTESGKQSKKSSKPQISVYLMDNKEKVWAKVHTDELGGPASSTPRSSNQSPTQSINQSPTQSNIDSIEDPDLESQIDDLMSVPLMNVTSPGLVEFNRAKSGFYGFRRDRNETLDDRYSCRVYDVKNIEILTEKRVEHLSEDEKSEIEQASKMLKQAEQEAEAEKDTSINQSVNHNEDDDGSIMDDVLAALPQSAEHRASLPPPPQPSLSYEEYFNENRAFSPVLIYSNSDSMKRELEAGGLQRLTPLQRETLTHLRSPPQLARPIECTAERKNFTAQVWMTDEFPLSVESIISILDLIAPHSRHVSKLRTFLESRLPPGFPVKIHLPIFRMLAVTVAFKDYRQGVQEVEMKVPNDYQFKPESFKLLSIGKKGH